METILQVKNIRKKIGTKKVIDNINMTINKGDIYGLVGKNGAGKTTLMKIILSILSYDEGSISFRDDILRDKKIGALIENPAFFPYMTVKENMEYYRILKGICDKNSVSQAIEEVGLKGAENIKYKALSLGMKQRLGIALAFLGNPELIILDEPINGLDPEGIKAIREIIMLKQKRDNATVIISSHILTELSQMANRVGIIDHGIMIKEITVEDLSKEASSKILVEVEDVDEAVKVIRDNRQDVHIKQVKNNQIMLEGDGCTVKGITQLLMENHIGITEIRKHTMSLEDYYIKLIRNEEKNEDVC